MFTPFRPSFYKYSDSGSQVKQFGALGAGLRTTRGASPVWPSARNCYNARGLLKVLLAERKIAGTPPYTQADLAQVTGRYTVGNLANNKTQRYDAHVLDGICTVLGCKIGELLVHVPDELQT